MKKLTTKLFIAHPFKHHVFHLAKGCQMATNETLSIFPVYHKNIIRNGFASNIDILNKLKGYHLDGLNDKAIHSPVLWTLKRLLKVGGLERFRTEFDTYVATLIREDKVKCDCFVSLQDYMPNSVAAASDRGIKVWSDQISNSSNFTRKRIAANAALFNMGSGFTESEDKNSKILKMADVVTYPSSYVYDGIADRVNSGTRLVNIPYGIHHENFSKEDKAGEDDNYLSPVKIIARANTVRKGGHLFLKALEVISNQVRLSGDANLRVEVTIIGKLDAALLDYYHGLDICDAITLVDSNVPHNKMPKHYLNADFFAMPSLGEGMSLACLEAMSCGLPVVSSKFCGVDLLIDQSCGPVVDLTVESIASAIWHLTNNKHCWNDYSQQSIEKASAYSWSNYETGIKNLAMDLI